LFYEVVLVGRGGQGVVTSGMVLADGFLRNGMFVQTFPEFGPERAGAPVKAYVRVSNIPIEVYTPVEMADAAIVFDPKLLKRFPLERLVRVGGVVVVNAAAGGLGESLGSRRVCNVPATEIANAFGKPLSVGIALLGAFAAFTELVPSEKVAEAVALRIGAGDVRVFEEGFRRVMHVAAV